jgi:hypothetical protein
MNHFHFPGPKCPALDVYIGAAPLYYEIAGELAAKM